MESIWNNTFFIVYFILGDTMIDLTNSYDFQIILNGSMPIGVYHSFSPTFLNKRFKKVSFEVKRKKLGYSFQNVRIM